MNNPVLPISKVIRIFSDHLHPESFKSEKELRTFIEQNKYQKIFNSPDNFYESYQRPGWPNNQGNLITLDHAGNILSLVNFQI